MFGLKVRHDRNIEADFDIAKEIAEAKVMALADGRRLLREEQAAGRFPTEPEDYDLRLRNLGRENRRQFDKIRVRYLRIPFSLEWAPTGGDAEMVRQAAIYAVGILRRRAPVFRGHYRRSVSLYINARPVSTAALLAADLTTTDSVMVAPNMKYASTIELGYFRGSYTTEDAARLTGGIVRPIAAMVRDRFGAEVNCRFTYIAFGARAGGTGGTMPTIEIGLPGSFPQNDFQPGKKPRRGRRRG